MVEQNTAASEDVVAFAVVHREPVRVELSHTVGAAGVEGRGFLLGNFLYLAEHFGCAGLIVADAGVDHTDGFKQTQCAESGDLGGGLWLIKRNPHKALCRKIIDFIGLDAFKQAQAAARIGQVIFNQMKVRMLVHA